MPKAVRREPPAPTLAKFSRPRLYNVQKRERLFRLLDERRSHPIIWIAGPPGSGKSTLAASYVETRRVPGLWFQADPGDADPATFFHYLRVAAADVAGRKSRDAAALPTLTAEYASDLPAFTRRFLREFFALFPKGSVLVVDNFHEPKGEAPWRFAFAEGLREIPDGVNLLVLSREPPVPEMARLVGEQRITRLEWDTLRFTEDEACALAAPAHVDANAARAIHRASDGWAAGIVLMREHLARADTDPEALLPEGKEAVFQYFTGEIFGRARSDSQRVLMLAALLPSVTAADAEILSGNPEAPLVLDYVYRRHLFTERRRLGAEPVYQFHALFREFLLAQGRRRLLPQERAAALDRAAGQLVVRGDFDAAAELYLEAKAWPALVGLTLHAGRPMLAEGRRRTLLRWLDALPPDVRATEPRLLLVEAHALMFDAPARCKALLDQAFAIFESRHDVRRQLLTAAAAIDCHYFEWADFTPLDRWIEVIERLTHVPDPPFLSTADGLRIRGAQLIALLFRQPDNPRIDEAAHVVETLLEAPDILSVPVNDRVNAASILFNYMNWKTKGNTTDALVERVEPWLAEPSLTAMNRVWWQVHRAFNEQIRGHYARSRKIMEDTESLAAAHGLRWVQVEIYHAEVTALISSEDVQGATAALAKLKRVLLPSRRMDLAYFKYQETGVLMLQGRVREAAAAAREAVDIGRASGLPIIQIPHFLVRCALCHVHLGQIEEAQRLYDEAIALATPADRRNFEFHGRLLRAHRALAQGHEAHALDALRTLLADCRESNYYGFLRLPAAVLSPLMALALTQGLETDYVRKLIRRRKLPPPPGGGATDWPWPLALRTLGEFTVLREGEPLVSKGKAQKKPLELLKALVAHGGRGVDAAMLTALVWPDAEGDDAKTSFDSNLYRLRKLLDVDGALQLGEGKLTLDPATVWLDTWALEAALDAGEVAAALALYRGPFLALDAALPWMLPLRDRLQARLVRAVLAQGEAHEDRGEWTQARALYERTLEVDNLAEPVYRRLMVCLREAGDGAAALSVYRRCRELLSIVLGRMPAAETEAVRATL